MFITYMAYLFAACGHCAHSDICFLGVFVLLIVMQFNYEDSISSSCSLLFLSYKCSVLYITGNGGWLSLTTMDTASSLPICQWQPPRYHWRYYSSKDSISVGYVVYLPFSSPKCSADLLSGKMTIINTFESPTPTWYLFFRDDIDFKRWFTFTI